MQCQERLGASACEDMSSMQDLMTACFSLGVLLVMTAAVHYFLWSSVDNPDLPIQSIEGPTVRKSSSSLWNRESPNLMTENVVAGEVHPMYVEFGADVASLEDEDSRRSRSGTL